MTVQFLREGKKEGRTFYEFFFTGENKDKNVISIEIQETEKSEETQKKLEKILAIFNDFNFLSKEIIQYVNSIKSYEKLEKLTVDMQRLFDEKDKFFFRKHGMIALLIIKAFEKNPDFWLRHDILDELPKLSKKEEKDIKAHLFNSPDSFSEKKEFILWPFKKYASSQIKDKHHQALVKNFEAMLNKLENINDVRLELILMYETLLSDTKVKQYGELKKAIAWGLASIKNFKEQERKNEIKKDSPSFLYRKVDLPFFPPNLERMTLSTVLSNFYEKVSDSGNKKNCDEDISCLLGYEVHDFKKEDLNLLEKIFDNIQGKHLVNDTRFLDELNMKIEEIEIFHNRKKGKKF